MTRALTQPRYALGALCAAVLALGATACGTERQSTSGGAGTASFRMARVTIEDYEFAPATARVRVGGTITFRNLDSTEHTATAANDRSFDSGTIKARGATRAVRFTRAGRFAYYCAFHPYMKGTVLVTR